MARIRHKNQIRYFLRESLTVDGAVTFRDLFDLGYDPCDYINYAGKNAYYFDEDMEDALSEAGAEFDFEILEDLFWPWIRPDVREAVDAFRHRSEKRRVNKLTDAEKERINKQIHNFDKRRAHYLRVASMDQGAVENMPAALFKHLADRSRDEIEQTFLQQETAMNVRELKSYVYTVFDLQQFFSGFPAKKMPHALDQEKVDRHFLEELCRLNHRLFERADSLHPYMIRYVIMFFDYPYENTRLLDEFAKDFMYRHHFHRPKRQGPTTEKALKVFRISEKQIKTMTRRELTKQYRKLARKRHPDTGGAHETFVELNNAYKRLLDRIKSRG